jgi:hypothetical protein
MGSRCVKDWARGRFVSECYSRIDLGMGNPCRWPDQHLPGHAAAAPVHIFHGRYHTDRLDCGKRGTTRVIGRPQNGCALCKRKRARSGNGAYQLRAELEADQGSAGRGGEAEELISTPQSGRFRMAAVKNRHYPQIERCALPRSATGRKDARGIWSMESRDGTGNSCVHGVSDARRLRPR